jgi:hypothetical protein
VHKHFLGDGRCEPKYEVGENCSLSAGRCQCSAVEVAHHHQHVHVLLMMFDQCGD